MAQTIVEFRIPEDRARKTLPPDLGRTLGDSVRVVEVAPGDLNFELIGHLERKFHGRYFASFQIRRRYTDAELDAASLLHWKIHTRFEPTGEECGTRYDYSTACGRCRVGRTQVSELVLDLARVPKKDIAITIGGEIVVSARFADLLESAAITGIELRPVGDIRNRRRRPVPPRQQLVITSPPVDFLTPPTKICTTPFDLDPHGQFRCPGGHVVGPNLLSEAWIPAPSGAEHDVAATRQHLGDPAWRGLLVPEPIRVASPRLLRLLRSERITGSLVEVAHLQESTGPGSRSV